MTRSRGPIALLLGLLASLALFWLMQMLILQNSAGLKKNDPMKVVEFVRIKRDKDLEIKRRELPKKPRLIKPPPPKMETKPPDPVEQPPPPELPPPVLKVAVKAPKMTRSVVSNVKVKVARPKPEPVRKVEQKPKPVVQSKPAPKAKPTPVRKPAPVKAEKQAPAGPSRVKVGSNELIAISKKPPKYPKRALRKRTEGWVKVRFVVTVRGTVKEARVVGSSPSGVFDKAALKAVRGWKFKPKKIKGVAVEQLAVQRLQFKLSRRRR